MPHIWQSEIGQNNVDRTRMIATQLQCLIGASGNERAEASALEHPPHNVAQVLLIVNDEHHGTGEI
ncbi:hypothetical protein Adu01nite_81200 [Paractinoplanes durhamensis]|uniref:Uncharacterized protein n=1 Tax=Paractinoplanes durhamensis TaxID=113563 RepID=A0ABQ3ZAA9_9ACTN|nr:hypothetical protein Adu01nite_81200 [Actinoplanes durhamensis]